MTKKLLGYSFIILLGSASATHAATITWQPSVNMYQGSTVETFVDTSGTSVVAYNNTTDVTSGDTDVTVNGVAFSANLTGTPLIGTGGHSITMTGGTDNENAFGDGEFSSNAGIFHLIRGATFGVSTITLGGLQSGNDYLIQVFNNDARGNRNENFTTGYGDGTGSAAPVGFSSLNNSPANGDAPVLPQTDVGDSIIGTFTANSATQTFNIFGSTGGAGGSFTQGDGRAQINAIQLRDLGPSIPEPSSALLVLAGMCLGLRRRR